jgi:chromate transporter
VSEPAGTVVPTPGELFLRFTQVAVSGFGGVLPFARRMLVEERHWLSAEEFAEVMSLCQLLPGPNIVNIAVCIGARYHGARGAAAAAAGLMTAPFLMMLALGALYAQYGHLPAVSAVFRGVSAAAAGLIVAVGIKMAASRRLRSAMALFTVTTFTAIAIFRVPLLPLLLFAAPASVAAAFWRER